MKQGVPEGMTWMFFMVGLIYMLGHTSNPIGYVALMFSTYWIYKLLKKEEVNEIANGR